MNIEDVLRAMLLRLAVLGLPLFIYILRDYGKYCKARSDPYQYPEAQMS